MRGGHLKESSTIADVLKEPAFAGFAPLLLPWDNRSYDTSLPLSRIATLMPYHSQVNTSDVTSGLNRMVDDASAGQTIFYRFYTPDEVREDSRKANTGLFFFRGKPGAPFAIISPGGGFHYVGALHEGFPYAAVISSKGLNAFVLRYRAGEGEAAPTEDLAQALDFVLQNAKTLGVSTAGYSLWGSSAGARMAANAASDITNGQASYKATVPAAVIMAYTGHSAVGKHEPPTFIIVGERDGIAPPAVMERRAAALRKIGVPVEMHRYAGLGHGFGLGSGTAADGWTLEAIRFWKQHTGRS